MLAVLDELFPTESPWLDDFCSRMRELNLLWIAQLRVNGITSQSLSIMKDAGLFYISYGIESASPVILKSMRKHITVPEVEHTLALTRKKRIGIQGNLLFGDPAETPATASTSLNWWEHHASYHLAMNFVIPYPGSAIYAQCLKNGLIPDKMAFIEQGCPPPNMTTMDDSELESLGARIAELKAGNRIFCKAHAVERGMDAVRRCHLYDLSAVCPCCKAVNTYADFICEQIDIFNLSCRLCNQRFDCSPMIFPHLAARCAQAQAALAAARDAGRPMAGAPALFRPTFEEYLSLLGFSFTDFDWRFFLDARPKRHGIEYAPGVFVRPLTAESLTDRADNLAIIILPCRDGTEVLRILLENALLPTNLIIHVS